MSNYSVDDEVLICPKCDKGREVCTLCWNQDWTVYKQICDCGLYEHGVHMIPCEVVEDEEAHAALMSHPVLEAEAEHSRVLATEEWTEEDDEARRSW